MSGSIDDPNEGAASFTKSAQVRVGITRTGLITSLGNDSPSTCAAIRCGIDNVRETRFSDSVGEWINAGLVERHDSKRGGRRLLALAAEAISECLTCGPLLNCERVPLILCLPEKNRPGRLIADDDAFFRDLQQLLGVEFSRSSRVLTHGHVSVATALQHAQRLLAASPDIDHVIVAGADSLISAAALNHFERQNRLMTSQHSDGFIPAEAGAALVIEREGGEEHALYCHGVGFATEPSPILSGKPMRAEGLTQAILAALADAGSTMWHMAYRMTDISGEQYHFKEAALALTRSLHQRREEFDVLHPADCVGETGAASGLITLAYQRYLYSVDPPSLPLVLAHWGDEDGKRAAMVLGFQ